MATVTCKGCSKPFTRTCSCQGNICPSCKAAKRAGATAAARVNGRRQTAKVKVQHKVTYGDKRKPTFHDTAVEAAEARRVAREAGVRTFMRTIRKG